MCGLLTVCGLMRQTGVLGQEHGVWGMGYAAICGASQLLDWRRAYNCQLKSWEAEPDCVWWVGWFIFVGWHALGVWASLE